MEREGSICRTVWPVEEDLLWKWSVLDPRAKQLLSTKASNSIYFPTEIFGNSAWWKAYLRQPIECILPHPALHFSWQDYRRKRNCIICGRKQNVRKVALVISFSRGKWSFFRSVFHFLYLQQFAIFPFFHLFCFCFASCYFVAFGCRFSTKIKTVTLIIRLCNHNSAALFKKDKK